MSTSPPSDGFPLDLDLYGSCACFYSLCEFLCMYLEELNDIVVKGILGELLEDRLFFCVERAGCSIQVCGDKDGCSVVAEQALRNGYCELHPSGNEKSSSELGLSLAFRSFQATDKCESYDI